MRTRQRSTEGDNRASEPAAQPSRTTRNPLRDINVNSTNRTQPVGDEQKPMKLRRNSSDVPAASVVEVQESSTSSSSQVNSATSATESNKRRRLSGQESSISSQVDSATSATESNKRRRLSGQGDAISAPLPPPSTELVPDAPAVIADLAPPPPPTRLVRVVRERPAGNNTADLALCLDTIDDMFERWKDVEITFSPTHYMDEQRDITYRMRGILVDWLLEVHYKFKLHGASLWLTVNLMDRYLQRTSITRDKLQLVGVASLLIASKFDEVSPPEVASCVHITDNSYSRKELLNMEYRIFETLGFQVSVPTGFNFITYFLGIIDADERLKFTALYYAERNLQEQHFLSVLPTHFAAAAVLAALWKKKSEIHNPFTEPPITASAIWPTVLEEVSGFTGESLMPCVRNMILYAGQEPVTTQQRRLIAAKKKYSQEKYFNIAALTLPAIP